MHSIGIQTLNRTFCLDFPIFPSFTFTISFILIFLSSVSFIPPIISIGLTKSLQILCTMININLWLRRNSLQTPLSVYVSPFVCPPNMHLSLWISSTRLLHCQLKGNSNLEFKSLQLKIFTWQIWKFRMAKGSYWNYDRWKFKQKLRYTNCSIVGLAVKRIIISRQHHQIPQPLIALNLCPSISMKTE